jgi:hypothetical protein
MTDLINQLRYLSRVTKDYDQEHMTSADYEMIPIVTKHAADRIEELVKELNISRMASVVMDNTVEELEVKLTKAEKDRDGYLAERNKFQLYLQRTHADCELEVAAVDALTAKLAKAVETLRFYAPQTVGGITFVGGDDAGKRAAAVLAELEGKE